MKKFLGTKKGSKPPQVANGGQAQTPLDFGGPVLPLGALSPNSTSVSTNSPLATPSLEPGLVRPTPVYSPQPSSQSVHHSPTAIVPSSSNHSAASPPPINRVMSPRTGIQPAQSPNFQTHNGTTSNGRTTELVEANPADNPNYESSDLESKLSVGIDFGTTFSGVAFGSSRLFSGQIRQILNWPGSYETFRKVPTCIAYYQASPNEEAQIIAWGLEASSLSLREGFYKVEWFKLFLDPLVLRDGQNAASSRLPQLPHGKQPIDCITDYLSCLWRYAKERIIEEIGIVADLDAANVILTVPAAWDATACSLMREAAIRAGLVQSSRGGDFNWRDRLQIITEPEAAAIHASTLASLVELRPSMSFLLCDAGGGTVDTAVYKLIGQLSALEIAEMCSRTGANSGSLFLDLRFEALVKSLLKNHPVHLEPSSLLSFRHAFSDSDKLMYLGEEDDDTHFRFNCFNIEDAHDPSVGLESGELVIPGSVLRRDVFDPIVSQVLGIIETQLSKVPGKSVNALILVGGLSSSQYLFQRVQEAYGGRIGIIAKPRDSDVSVLKGAARYGLGKPTVSSVISPRSYIMKCKLPAEDVDRYQRPGFISTNDAGVEVCENRLSYLVAKGAVLRKGQKLRSRFCKFSRSPLDCHFTAILYVSDEDRIFRYTDEGEILELCRWSVDLSTLPSFQYHAQTSTGGFYTEFDLGLIFDSAEVLGVLLDDEGRECGRATFEFS
ncbi:Hsp70 family protein [Sporobolomyces salmoneus]|uniref:Hsp70 family protein n=1 Tax=Sporobolomyces salmoneus TaxID=183962 RepID=UPI003173A9FB